MFTIMIAKKSLVIASLVVVLVLTGCGKKDAPTVIDTTQGSAITQTWSSQSIPTQWGFIPQ